MDAAPEPMVSVIVPFFNSAGTIGMCLEALGAQDDGRFEVVAVDDGSTDDGPATAASVCARFGFRLVTMPHNKGQAVARNAGVRNSSGDLLAFVDADVVVSSDWVSRWRAVMSGPDAPDAACGGYRISTGEPPAALFASHEAHFRRMNLRSHRLTSITTANCVIRRAAFLAAGGFPEYYIDPRGDTASRKAVASNEDSELGYLMARGGAVIVWDDSNPVRHVFRPTWRGYMRQQRAFAWSGTVSVFRFPGILLADDLYSGERVIPQLAATLLMTAAPLLAAFGVRGALAGLMVEAACLLFFAAYHRRFFGYLRGGAMGGYGRLLVFWWMVAARFVWLCGVAQGIMDGAAMRWRYARIARAAGGRTGG